MDTIIEKLNQPKITNLSEDEWNIIYQNIELRSLFLKRLEEGTAVDLSDINYEFWEILMSKKYINYTLDSLKHTDIYSYLNFFALEFNEDARIELENDGIQSFDSIINYYNKNKNEILKLFMANIDSDRIDSVSNDDMIALIINNNLTQYIHLIKKENPSNELENFIINNIDDVSEPLKTYSKRIEDTCIKHNKIILLSNFYKKSDNIVKSLLKAIDEEKIADRSSISSFLFEYRDNPIVKKYNILKKQFHLVDLSEELLNTYPELVNFIIEAIKNNEISTFLLDDINHFPNITAAIIENLYSGNDLISLLRYNWDEKIAPSFEKDPELIISSISKALDKDVSIASTLFEYLVYKDDYKLFDSIFKKIVSILTIKDIVDIYSSYNKDRTLSILSEYEDYLNFSVTTLPEFFNFSEAYSEKILLKIIPILNEEQLDKEKLNDAYFATPKLLETIMVRLAELRSDKFNDAYYLFKDKLTPKMKEIILREDNPLNLTISQTLNFIPNAQNDFNFDYLNLLIDRNDTLTTVDFNAILYMLFSTTYNREERKNVLVFDDKKLEVLYKVFNFKIEDDDYIYWIIYNNLNAIELNSEYKDKIIKIIRDFLYNHEEVPLYLTKHFDKELRIKSTYNINNLSTKPQLFDSEEIPDDFKEFVINASKNNYPIDLVILFNTIKNDEQNYYLLAKDNLTYNNKKTYDIIRSIIGNGLIENSIEERCICNWLKKIDLTNLFKSQQDSIIKNLFKNENLFRIIIERANNLDIIYSGQILEYLSYEYNEDFKPLVKKFIFKQMANEKIKESNITITEELLSLTDPEVETYLVKNYFSKNNNYNWISKNI